MKIPHPIPYQGSKRQIAKYILAYFPQSTHSLIEPFAGSAAISIAAACYAKASKFHLNDSNTALMALWKEIIYNPHHIAERYEQLWKEQQSDPRAYYDEVREKFNRTQQPHYLLYLLARCVKASVRYNPRGEFNQSPDNRRLGRNPQRMADDILAVSKLFYGRVELTSCDYTEVLAKTTQEDLVYMDPPYQGVCDNGEPRYFSGIDRTAFVHALEELNRREIPYILSFDGRTGDKKYGKALPIELDLCQIEIRAGRSSQATLLGRNEITFESVYLSKALVERLGMERRKPVSQLIGEPVPQLRILEW
ncbi:MAG TPA: Dam family site-specific DNA-(adenine-N6)-methyltransferase [Chthonomonas sp.]|uniref:Dam family site-specific DNA-(adenine-N6)-methyltransferase n=1 Tax=Chthonomonas sp. TaxID=2282153 RepID=UPI002B4AEC86|nr:Dam family site-specific DNA-(adenine-N6)-methyltransferase [Chthonomonas sp.]HLI48175.1 Dam family site-specific DNA-(adenine-N6)-methyltransferase [Chthonomonas sp.]